jgi:hypothetical protein
MPALTKEVVKEEEFYAQLLQPYNKNLVQDWNPDDALQKMTALFEKWRIIVMD